jgi:hypothetical protein
MLNIPLLLTYKDKGSKQALSSMNKLEKRAKSLGKTLGLTLSTAAVVAFGKASIKAFLQDDKAAKQLSKTLDNLGIAFESPAVADFIAKMEKATGVADDELRPAFNSLVIATHDATKAQDMLGLALDVSAGTGKDLGTVTAALQKAYLGNNTALQKLGVGLTKAELASTDFNAISEKLTKLFGGAAEANAATYSGQLDILARSADNAKESIGKGLLTAIMSLSASNSINELSDKIESIGTNVGYAFIGVGALIDKAQEKISDNSALKFLYDVVNSPSIAGLAFGFLSKEGKKASAVLNANSSAANASARDLLELRKKEIAAAEKLAKQRAIENTKSKKAIVDQTKLKQASAKFDLDKIQIEAALKGKINEEERLRLLLQQAILNEDIVTAEKLQIQLQINQNKTSELAMLLANLPDANDPFADWEGTIAKVNSLLKDLKLNITAAQLLGSKGITLNAAGTNIVTPLTPNPSAIATAPLPFPTEAQQAALYAAATPEQQTLAQQSAAEINSMFTDIAMITDSLFGMPLGATTAAPTVIVNVAGSVQTEQDLADAIVEQIYVRQANGIGINYNTRTAL